jgi:hypothetical protein
VIVTRVLKFLLSQKENKERIANKELTEAQLEIGGTGCLTKGVRHIQLSKYGQQTAK